MNSKSAKRARVASIAVALLALGGAGTIALRALPAASQSVASNTPLDPLFDNPALGTTQSALVMQGGEIVAERYAEGIGPETPLLSRSIAKCVSAVLVGLMVSDGRLALDSPVPVAAWSQPGDPRGGITLRHLLTMSSGLEHRETGEPLAMADTVRMLFTDGAADMAAYSEAKPVAARPGSRFNYSTSDTQIIADLMTRMLTDSNRPDDRRAAMEEFLQGRLVTPVGLGSFRAEYDARGTLIGGAFLHMTTRDYARFGEFLRNKGRANGQQILSPRWVKFMTAPSERNPAYGGQLWLNREGESSPLFPGRGSRSLFACVGHHGQYVIVSPAQRLVIVRMGLTAEEDMPALRSALARLVEQFPAG